MTAAAFVSGGALPEEVRGTVNYGLMAIADWYTTFAGFAGVDPFDPLANASHLPPVDGLDMWPMLSQLGAGTARARPEGRRGTLSAQHLTGFWDGCLCPC